MNVAAKRNLFLQRSSSHHMIGSSQISGGGGGGSLMKSSSVSNCTVVTKRGFKPSDRYDPHKREFLTNLSQKLWHVSLDETSQCPVSDGLQHSKTIDLEKLFTPATDSGEQTPRNRKMYASSSFYSTMHPTVEDQVELARRISHSLSDISNQQSKGQSMYVNRKKRSVKWVHEGTGEVVTNNESESYESVQESHMSFKIPNMGPQEMKFKEKPPLKLLMDPRGQIQDITSLRKQGFNIEPGSLSPEIAFDLVRDLNAPKGKGAELFAKRRKKSEKWIVDENTVKMSSSMCTTPDVLPTTPASYLPQKAGGSTPQKPQPTPSTPSYLKDNRAQVAQKLNEIQERFSQPRIKMIKSPWEAALETGSVDTAFQELPPLFQPRGFVVAPTPAVMDSIITYKERTLSPPPPIVTEAAPSWMANTTSNVVSFSPQQLAQRVSDQGKEYLYKPKMPRAWNTQAPEPFGSSVSEQPLLSQEVPLQKQPPSVSQSQDQKRFAVTNVNNYNTAARGWGQGQDYYRPVTFSK